MRGWLKIALPPCGPRCAAAPALALVSLADASSEQSCTLAYYSVIYYFFKRSCCMATFFSGNIIMQIRVFHACGYKRKSPFPVPKSSQFSV